jgi:hypothetical protein
LKNNIKKSYILQYLQKKFNDTSQELGFMFGQDGMELYRPINKETSTGEISTDYEFDEETYALSITSHIPVSFPIIEADYTSLAEQDLSQRITTSSWSTSVSFLVFADSYFQTKAMIAMEEFRDKFLGKIDFLEGRLFDYDTPTVKPVKNWYTVVTHAGDLVPSGSLTINGANYIEWSLLIDLDISDELAYGNQFEFWVKGKNDENYERILPIMASWGASNTLEAFQLLKNKYLTSQQLDKAKMLHNIVSSRGFGINFTLFFNPEKPIVKTLFKETFAKKDELNNIYCVKILFNKKSYDEDGIPFFEEDSDLSFEYKCVIGEGGTEVVYGDTIVFTIGLSPSWKE